MPVPLPVQVDCGAMARLPGTVEPYHCAFCCLCLLAHLCDKLCNAVCFVAVELVLL